VLHLSLGVFGLGRSLTLAAVSGVHRRMPPNGYTQNLYDFFAQNVLERTGFVQGSDKQLSRLNASLVLKTR